MDDGDLHCDTCGRTVAPDDAVESGTYGDLSERWTTLCCPDCGARLQTVFRGKEPGGEPP